MLEPPLAPMEARSVEELPEGAQWQFEPKWDGFRCLAFRTDDEVYLQSKAQQPLGRYFPEIVKALGGLRARRCVLDGELAVLAGEGFSFDALLQRVHPAAFSGVGSAAPRPVSSKAARSQCAWAWPSGQPASCQIW